MEKVKKEANQPLKCAELEGIVAAVAALRSTSWAHQEQGSGKGMAEQGTEQGIKLRAEQELWNKMFATTAPACS